MLGHGHGGWWRRAWQHDSGPIARTWQGLDYGLRRHEWLTTMPMRYLVESEPRWSCAIGGDGERGGVNQRRDGIPMKLVW